MTPLLIRWLALRHWQRQKLRFTLVLLSVALGVATYVGMNALNRATLESFRATARLRSGNADFVLRSGMTGVPRSLAEDVRRLPGVQAAVPLVLRFTSLRVPATGAVHPVLLAGVDPGPELAASGLAPADSLRALVSPLEAVRFSFPVFLNAAWAGAQGLAPADSAALSLPAGLVPVQVAGLLEPAGLLTSLGGAVVIAPLAPAAAAFCPPGTVDRILVQCAPDAEPETVRGLLERACRERARVADPLEEAREFDAVMGSIRLALRLVSLFALLIAAFLVHGALAMALTERRGELAVLRVVGMEARRVRTLLWSEALVLGSLGSVLGVLLGGAAARGMSTLFWSSIGATFDRIDPVAVRVGPAEMLVGFATGPLAALVAALVPAHRAARSSALEGLRAERTPVVRRRRRGAALLAALGLAAASLWLGSGAAPRAGYLSFLALVGAAVLGAYPLLSWLTSGAGRLALRHTGPGGRLALDHFQRSPRTEALTLVAVVLGFGLVHGNHLIVRSYEDLLEHWFDTALGEDLFVLGDDFLTGGLQGTSFAPELGERLLAVPGVLHVQPLRFHQLPLAGRRILLIGFDAEAPGQAGAFEYVEGEPADRRRLRPEREVFVSVGFSQHHGMHRGDVLRLETPAGEQAFRVAAVVEDYSWPLGSVFMDNAVHAAAFGTTPVQEFGLTLDGTRQRGAVRSDVQGLLAGEFSAVVLTREEIEDTILGVFHEYWSLFLVQEAVAVLVAFLGTFHALLLSVLLREREIGLLRALGAPRAVLRRMIRAEGCFLGVGGGLLGVLFGVGMAAIAVGPIGLEEQGYRAPLVMAPGSALLTVAGAGVTGWLAGILPARRAARIDALRVIAEE